jgi:methylmalonyl-CoA mutase N-terminal domain/subunit
MEEEARRYFREIAEQGGMIAAVENGYFRRQIADSAFAQQRAIDAGEKLVVGVNAFTQTDDSPIQILEIDPVIETAQIESLRAIKSRRSADGVAQALDQIRRDAAAGKNVLPALLEAADARATVQECMDALAGVLGRFRPATAW